MWRPCTHFTVPDFMELDLYSVIAVCLCVGYRSWIYGDAFHFFLHGIADLAPTLLFPANCVFPRILRVQFQKLWTLVLEVVQQIYLPGFLGEFNSSGIVTSSFLGKRKCDIACLFVFSRGFGRGVHFTLRGCYFLVCDFNPAFFGITSRNAPGMIAQWLWDTMKL